MWDSSAALVERYCQDKNGIQNYPLVCLLFLLLVKTVNLSKDNTEYFPKITNTVGMRLVQALNVFCNSRRRSVDEMVDLLCSCIVLC